ncbi:MAG: WG repeat-containing protein [Bacteroidales bacterium]|nr:WG repeat-containing protein [Bacteroidales bacterium]
MRTVNIFISSTFIDMHAERDAIAKYVVPRLNDALRDDGISVMATDLRWGINIQDVAENLRERKVLRRCLDAIAETRPYFVALLGARYGWQPPLQLMQNLISDLPESDQGLIDGGSKSVTEVEILLGALRDPETLRHSFFCFRDDNSYAQLPPDTRAVFTADPEGKQRRLKDRIIEACADSDVCTMIEYSPEWNPEKEAFGGFSALIDSLYQAIHADIVHSLTNGYVELTAYQSYARQEELMRDRALDSFHGRKAVLKDLTDFIDDFYRGAHPDLRLHGLILEGDSGTGKTAIYAKLCQEFREKGFAPICFSAGIGQDAVSDSWMIGYLNSQMAQLLEEEDDQDDRRTLEIFNDYLMRLYSAGLRPVVVIDSLDSFQYRDYVDTMKFIPPTVPYVCTAIPGIIGSRVQPQPQTYLLYSLPPFTAPEAREMVGAILKRHHKELPPNLIDCLMLKSDKGIPAHAMPIWIKQALNILMELGSQDFRAIYDIQSGPEDQINVYLRQEIKEMPSSAAGLFRYSIDKGCQYFQPRLTRRSLAFISIAYQGLRQDDLAALLAQDWDLLEFDALRFWLDTFLVKSADDAFVLSHAVFANVVRGMDADLMEACSIQYKEYLMSHITDERILMQLCSAVIQSGDIDLMHELATNDNVIFYGKGITPCVNLLAQDTQRMLDFVGGYLEKYDRESGDWIDQLFEQIPSNFPEGKARYLMLRLAQTEVTTAGDVPAEGRAAHFFNCYAHLDEYYHQYDDENVDRWSISARMVDIFEQCIERWPEQISDYQYQYSFLWMLTRYIWHMDRQSRDDEQARAPFRELLNRSIKLMQWFLEHCNPHWLPNERTIEWMYQSVLSRNFLELSQNELTDLAVRIHGLQLLIKPEAKYRQSTYENACEELVQAYSKHFTEIEFIPTRLCELYPQFVCYRKEHTTKEPDFSAFLDEEDSKQKIAKAAESEAPSDWDDSGLSYEDYLDIFSDDGDEEDDGEEEDAPTHNLLTSEDANRIILGVLGNLTWPYALSEGEIDQLIYLLDNLGDIPDPDIRKNLILNMCERIKQPIFRHADDLGWLFRKIIEKLNENVEPALAQKTAYDLWDMAVRWQLERAFDEISRRYQGLGYLDPVYLRGAKDYFKSVGAAHYLEKVIADWEMLEARCFIDYHGDDVPFGDNELTISGAYHDLGYVNRNGQWVIPKRYHMARPFSEGLAAVGKGDAFNNGKWGFINSLGEEVIPMRYEKVGDFQDGVAWACIYGWRSQKKQAQFILIDPQGRQIGTDVYSDISSAKDGKVIAWKDGLILEIKCDLAK